MQASSTAENYLKCLFHLNSEREEIPITLLAETLSVSVPTANSMIKKLAAQGWVKYAPYKPVTLTRKGNKAAAAIVRKHRLTEMFLVQVMKFSWEQVHDIAEQMEHIDAPEFFDRIDQLLGFPKADPHGSPIPDKAGNIEPEAHISLADCKAGSRVKLLSLHQASQEFLIYLNKRKLKLGDVIKIIDIDSYDGSMTVTWSQSEPKILSKSVCEKLLVQLQ